MNYGANPPNNYRTHNPYHSIFVGTNPNPNAIYQPIERRELTAEEKEQLRKVGKAACCCIKGTASFCCSLPPCQLLMLPFMPFILTGQLMYHLFIKPCRECKDIIED